MYGSSDGDELEAETSDSDSDASTNADDAEVCEGLAIVSHTAASILPGTPYIHDPISVLELMFQAAAHLLCCTMHLLKYCVHLQHRSRQ